MFHDRLGSVVWREGTRMSYYPYGEEKGGTTEQGRDKFGTYHRDEVTGSDYAVNRYYGSGLGRFLSADPYQGPDAVKDPRGWNRYAYVEADPVNFNDASGLDRDSIQNYARCMWAPLQGEWSWNCGGRSGRKPRPHMVGEDSKRVPFESSERRQKRARNYLRRAIDSLKKAFSENPECRQLFSAEQDPTAVAEQMFGGTDHGSFQFSPDFGGDAETRPADSGAVWNATTEEWLHSVVDVVFNSGTATGYWLGTSDKERNRMLVHELGHVFMFRFGRNSSRFVYERDIDQQKANQELERICFPD